MKALTRRNALQLGSSLLGLGLADILGARARAAESGKPTNKKSLIVFWTHGGMSQQDTYDMKPEAPAEYRGFYDTIKTSVPGINVGERFPGQARVMHHISQVRSVHHENGIHAPSAHWMQTGRFGPTLARNAAQHPSFGSVIARSKGAQAPHMPAYVTIPKSEAFGYQAAVYLGKASNPFEVGADPNSKDFKVPNLALPKGLELKSVENRRKLLNRFDTLRRDTDNSGVLDGLNSFKAQALEMVTGDQVREAFDLNQEDDKLRDRYGRNTFGQSCLMARRLIENGTRYVNVNHFDTVFNVSCCDMHANGSSLNNTYADYKNHLCPQFDQAYSALIDDLEQRGLLKDTVVAVLSEFGRTPKLNARGGRDHYPNAWTNFLCGGNIRGGQVIGSSDRLGAAPHDYPLKPPRVIASIYKGMGIDLETTMMPGPGSRPIRLIDAEPIPELF